ncbi:alpha/beta fold hydrolase [Sneathiella limimaris]|uniref:alpha/beta fold hydrolase n=1 Tax=Sneathiella limimaris TaxID=1964213 RepID=UPI00146EEB70|nr:alpha/beta hydrolase [Sneathiella limimaris]
MKFIITVISLIVIVLCAAILYRGYVTDQLLPLDETARTQAPGEFTTLPRGVTHYQWHGPDDGEIVVLVHGFSTPSFVWRGIVGTLTGAGYRVLTYDLFGRGWSDRPDLDYTAELFDAQLANLLKNQGVDKQISLIGYSMGGAVATYFTASHPGQVRKLGLIAPAGFPVNDGILAKVIRVPLLGDWIMDVLGRGSLHAEMSKPENQGSSIPDLVERYELQMSYEGYLPALLSTLRNFPMGDLSGSYQTVGDLNVPTLALWGTEDSIVPPKNAELLTAQVPQAKVTFLEGGTHAITYSRADEVSSALVTFLRE